MTCSCNPVHEKIGYIGVSNYVNNFQSGALEPLGKTAGTLTQIKAVTPSYTWSPHILHHYAFKMFKRQRKRGFT